MKRLYNYCKPGVLERMVYLHPRALMIACWVQVWCEENGAPCIFTDATSDLREDISLRRTSSSHREGRAFDVSLRGWTPEMQKRCVDAAVQRFGSMGAIGATGIQRLVYAHDAGTGPHLHFQIHRQYALPVIDFTIKTTG